MFYRTSVIADVGMRIFDLFCSCDLDLDYLHIRPWPVFPEDIPDTQIWTSNVKVFDRHTWPQLYTTPLRGWLKMASFDIFVLHNFLGPLNSATAIQMLAHNFWNIDCGPNSKHVMCQFTFKDDDRQITNNISTVLTRNTFSHNHHKTLPFTSPYTSMYTTG